jgi:hypothetical protein
MHIFLVLFSLYKMPRITTPRKQIGEHKIEAFEQPLNGCLFPEDLENADGWGSILDLRPIPHLPAPPVGNFHSNIKRWIWSSPGKADVEAWHCIVELEECERDWETDEEKEEKRKINAAGPRFAYFRAGCGHTVFASGGGWGELTVASDVPSLIEFALTEAAYSRYMAGTEPAEAW